MGQKDLATRDYLKDNTVFADSVNYYIYKGEQVILPEDLKPMDPSLITGLYEKKGKAFLKQWGRDVLKYLSVREDGRRVYLIFGIEPQSEVHYAMPVRNMLYDALQYQEQIKRLEAKHREQMRHRSRKDGEYPKDNPEDGVENGMSDVAENQELDGVKDVGADVAENRDLDGAEDVAENREINGAEDGAGDREKDRHKNDRLTSAEFLSGLRKEERLVSVITIVINFSTREWDGALSVHELLDVTDEALFQYIPDYKINLISPHSMTEEEANYNVPYKVDTTS